MPSRDQRIARLRFDIGARTGIVHTTDPATRFMSGSVLPPNVDTNDARGAESAAESCGYADIGALRWHLAEPAPAGTAIVWTGDEALVAADDPEYVHHVIGFQAHWIDGQDPRTHRRVRVRDVLAFALDALDRENSLGGGASAHDLWRFYQSDPESRQIEPTTIGPYTGWMIEFDTRVRVTPFGDIDTRNPDRVQSVVDAAGTDVADWCDAHDTLRGTSAAASQVAAAATRAELDSDADLLFLAELFLDMILWAAEETVIRGPRDARIDSLGTEATAATDPAWSVRVTPDGAPQVFFGVGPEGFAIACQGGRGLPGIRPPEYRITVPRDEIDALCRRLGAPERAHPLPVLSLFADEILAGDPIAWLTARGVERFSEERPDDTGVDRKEVLDSFARRLFRPTGGGHGSGVGFPGTAEFPATWSEAAVMAAIEATVNEPESRIPIGRTVFDERVIDEVRVAAVWRRSADSPPRMVTAYPMSGPGVVTNPDPSDRPVDLATDTARLLADFLVGAGVDARLARSAAYSGEPYEAVLAGMWMALDHPATLSRELMNAIAELVYDEWFAEEDGDEVFEVYTALVDRDHPDNDWGPRG
ncbi:hypothetical protein RHCRD62_30370 [Rhodococcus sp. RD6.2]|uniref:EndoU domain-containing protein n=1 Tax=Rhodococcus sp. RD6.2 TaxID=260936 RepID=UPI00063B7D72|nr:EndoU domain-containing protein [Rhodococcus sp. RD6.2]CRK51706.1 hypothetical protein RHCRD62_30370 [Rhodococcus sp. RD6.2]